MTRTVRLLVAGLLGAALWSIGAAAATSAGTVRKPPMRTYRGDFFFSEGGRFVAIDQTDDYQRWALVDLQGKRALPEIPNALAGWFSPDDSHVAVVGGTEIGQPTTHVWDTASRQEVEAFPGYGMSAWSADGSTLVLRGGPSLVEFASLDGSPPKPAPTGLSAAPDCCIEVDSATLAPNGKWLAFLSASWIPGDRNVPSDLSVVPLGGGIETGGGPVCDGGGDRYAWSGDSSWIAYDSDDCWEEERPGLELQPVGGGLRDPHEGRTAAAGPALGEPARWDWSPRGHTIAFVQPGGLFLENAATVERVVIPAAFDFAWAPDGKRLVVVQRGLVRIVSASGKRLRTLGPGSDVEWSRANVVGYVRRGCGPAMGVHVTRPDGTHDRRLPGAVCVVYPRSSGRVDGTPWDDEIRAASSETRHSIYCGAGHDVVVAGPKDTVASDCEVVHRVTS